MTLRGTSTAPRVAARPDASPAAVAAATRGVRSGRGGPRLARDLGWAMTAVAANTAGVFAANLLVARLLAPSAVGAYFLAVTLVTLMALAARLGLEQVTVRAVAERLAAGDVRRLRGALTGLLRSVGVASVLVGATFLTPAGPVIVQALGAPALTGVTPIIGAWLVLEALRYHQGEALRGFRDHRAFTLAGEPFKNVTLAGALALVAVVGLGVRLEHVVMLSAVITGVSLALTTRAVRARTRPLPPAPADRPLSVLRAGLPLLLTNVGAQVLNRADVLVLGVLAAQTTVAVYGAAARVAILLSLPILVINRVVGPVISEALAQGDRDRVQAVLRIGGVANLLLSLPLYAVLLGAPDRLLGVLFGEFYAQGALALRVLAAGRLADALTGTTDVLLTMCRRERTVMIVSAAAAVVAVAGPLLQGSATPVSVAAWFAAATAGRHLVLCGLAYRHERLWTVPWVPPRTAAASALRAVARLRRRVRRELRRTG